MSGNLLALSPNARLNKAVLMRHINLPLPENKCQVMYVWIDGTQENLRAKTKTLNFIPQTAKDCPKWEYCGSATYEGEGNMNDMFLQPVQLFNDPFRKGNNKLLMCDAYKNTGEPANSNHRYSCLQAMDAATNRDPWFGLEQEYTLLDMNKRPLGWPKNGFPGEQGPYYCGVGADKVYGRDIVECHYRACLYAGINIAGSNAKIMLAQWEYQVGPCKGIDIGDHVWMSRFILHRVAEEFGVVVSLYPKPVIGNWCGTGADMNFSTKAMRDEDGIVEINKAVEKLCNNHAKHIKVYDPNGGRDNEQRLTESSIKNFSAGVADCGASVRIPRDVMAVRKGYLEDRRPASNCDPYLVAEALVRTCILNE